MEGYIKIEKNSDLEGKVVTILVDDGEHECDTLYHCSYNDDLDRWDFYDQNDVECREWDGEPSHYKLVNN